GKKAIELAGIHNYDLVFMDLKMPITDGYEATIEIKKLKPTIPILALTAFAFEDGRERAFQCGCAEVLTKPLDVTTIRSKLSKYLS
ncbi:MAG: response regulator, partial [Bacteroidetes bacterium]|nr:response regulator [Bacteroidota bacterium]